MRAHLGAHRHRLTVERLPAHTAELNPDGIFTPTSKGGELANCTADTIAKITDEAYHGIQRVCDSDSLSSASWPIPASASRMTHHPSERINKAGSVRGN
jgi:hypothetical protein